jgi:D-glycero-alpha-D-manno-heptose-7-phosphate kinase
VRSATATAPVRLDLAGGTLDIWPLYLVVPQPAITVNVALDLPMRVQVAPAPEGSTEIHLASVDRSVEETFPSLTALDAALARNACRLELLGRAVLAARPPGGLSLTTEASIPVGSGLGGSSSLLAAVLGTLSKALGRTETYDEIRRLAQDLEAAMLGGPTGYQDFGPPLVGGCLSITGLPGRVVIERLEVDLDALAARLRLVYTGEPHESGITNWGVLRAYFDREESTVEALHDIAACSREVDAGLRRGDLDAALASVVAEGNLRRRMAPGVATAEIDALDAAVRAAGAVGTKILGAGGGGCVLVVLPGTAPPEVDRVLAKGPWQSLPLRLTGRGLDVTLD